jgi:hypothetical protein
LINQVNYLILLNLFPVSFAGPLLFILGIQLFFAERESSLKEEGEEEFRR